MVADAITSTVTQTVWLSFSDGSNALDYGSGMLVMLLALICVSLGVSTGILLLRGRV